jgi:Protein of unknown function (DUF2934)
MTTELRRPHHDWLANITSSALTPTKATMLAADPQPVGHDHFARVAAYFRAETRTTAPGDPLRDWLMVEAAIAQMFPFPRKRS